MAIDYISIGARIRFYRTQKDMTLEELAEKTDVTKQHISHIELGEEYPNLELFILQAHQTTRLGFRSFQVHRIIWFL